MPATNAKWITFVQQPSTGKTSIFKVIAKQGNIDLGTIKWFSRFRKYSFFPEAGTIYENDCLKDLSRFLDELALERRAASLVK